MKIALNIEWIGARHGGAEKYAASVARALSGAGHDVHLVTRGVELGEVPAHLPVHQVRIHDVPGLGWARAFRFAWASARLLRRLRFDVVIGFNKTWRQDVYLAVAGAHPAAVEFALRRFQHPVARALHALGKRLSPKQWLFQVIDYLRFAGRQKPLVIAPSRMTAEHFRTYHDVPSSRIAVVYNGIEAGARPADRPVRRAAFRKSMGLADDQPALLFAAHNYELKGLEPLLAAFAQVAAARPRAVLIVCGNERDGAFRRRARRLGIADRVRFLGFVDSVDDCFAGCDAFVFPTFYDPCSLVVLEAMHHGLPVVTTRANGAAELITPGIDGLIVNSPDDVEALSVHLAALCDDPGLRIRLGRRAAERARSCTMQVRLSELSAVLERPTATSYTPVKAA